MPDPQQKSGPHLILLDPLKMILSQIKCIHCLKLSQLSLGKVFEQDVHRN